MSGARDAATTSCDLPFEKVQGYIKNIKTRLARQVESVQAPIERKPSLSIEPLPSTVSLQAGRVLSLSTNFTGNPSDIQWSLNGLSLSDGAEGGRISIESTSSSSTITVLSVQSADAGSYKLQIDSIHSCVDVTVTEEVINAPEQEPMQTEE